MGVEQHHGQRTGWQRPDVGHLPGRRAVERQVEHTEVEEVSAASACGRVLEEKSALRHRLYRTDGQVHPSGTSGIDGEFEGLAYLIVQVCPHAMARRESLALVAFRLEPELQDGSLGAHAVTRSDQSQDGL